MAGVEGKVALVTGASRGIGRAIALRLARGGVFVIATYRRQHNGANETISLIEEMGGSGFSVRADISKTHEIDAMFVSIDEELKARCIRGIDILVNNAGMPGGGADQSILGITENMLDKLFAVNVRGTVMVTQRALPRMIDGGRIINLSSIVSLAAFPDALGYAMSKAAVNSLTRSLALGLGKRQITVNAVAPGAINTDFIRPLLEDPQTAQFYAEQAALGRVGETRDIAGLVAFLASEEGGFITGQVIQATGGTHL